MSRRQEIRWYHTRRWRALRLRVLERDEWRCVKCGKAGRLEVDHVKPHGKGGLFWDTNNLQSLCRPCHFEKTASENAKPQSEEARQWASLVEEL